MSLVNILSEGSIRVPLESTEKRDAIDELIDLLVENGKASNPDSLKEAVWTREQTRTTGIGHGLAIPHGKCPGLSTPALAIGKPAEPMDFDALDGKPVKLIVLLASPLDRTSDHIQALAKISRLMTMDSFRESMYAAESAEEIYNLLREQEQGS